MKDAADHGTGAPHHVRPAMEINEGIPRNLVAHGDSSQAECSVRTQKRVRTLGKDGLFLKYYRPEH